MFKNYFLIFFVLAALVLTACAQSSASGASSAQSSEAITITQKFYEAIHQKKIDVAMSYVADDAVFINPTGTYKGKAEIQASLEGLAQDGISFDLNEFKDKDGRVNYAYKVLQNGQTLDSGTDGITIVKNGKVIFDGTETTEAEWLKAMNVPVADAQMSEAITVVKSYYEAYNKKQIDAAMHYLADDVLFINPTGTYEGKAQIHEHLQGLADGGLSFELSEFKDKDGRVTYAYKVLQNGQVVEVGTNGLTIATEPKP